MCPCGSPKNYQQCCGRFIESGQIPLTPEELMRSRYTAFTLANIDYIGNTMKSPAADNFNKQSIYTWAKKSVWIKLEVIHSSYDTKFGTVEFIACYSLNGSIEKIHEISNFRLDEGKWFYIDGKHIR